jgi:arginyl-tRNA synthetase
MQSVVRLLKDQLAGAIRRVTQAEELPAINPAPGNVSADFVSPTALKLYNTNKKTGAFGNASAQELAGKLRDQLLTEAGHLVETVEVAGNGFLNISVKNGFLEHSVTQIVHSSRISIGDDVGVQNVLVDFSSPNIAKEMHVGHLRSTIIGDSICKVFEFLGHRVKRVNHLGDWGTQFGMLLSYLTENFPDHETNPPDISDLELFYIQAKQVFDADAAFKERSKQRVVELQAGDEASMKIWRYICKVSREYLQTVYDRLHVTLEDYGESFYNAMLPSVVEELTGKGIAIENEGALCVFIPKKEPPLMLRKTNGSYGYDSTDLAAVRFRLLEEAADRVIYVTDTGQYPHFEMIFEAAKLAGWHTPPRTRLDHAGFGVVLGADGKRLRTRDGKTIKLKLLMDEARQKARDQLESRNTDQTIGMHTHLTSTDFEAASEHIGIAAIKYFDLKQNRISDYKFTFEKVLDPKGNTAVYLLYAYARICSILDKAGEEAVVNARASTLAVTCVHERNLAFKLARLPDVLDTVAEELFIHKLCDLQYDISVTFSEFYNHCKVLGSPEQNSRLMLCLATKLMMHQIFNLLGIEPLERL